MREFQAKKTDRLDRLLREQVFTGSAWISRQAWEWLIENGKVSLNGRKCVKSGAEVPAGALVSVHLPESLGLLPAPEAAEAVWEAAGLVAFNKPCGVDSVPLFPWETGSLANQACAYLAGKGKLSPEAFSTLAEPPRLEGGLLQRLDRDTSGLLLVALDPPTKTLFRQLFSRSALEKTYQAIAVGELGSLEGEHRFWLATGGGQKVRAFPSPPKGESEESALSVKVLNKKGKAAHVEVRTRQGARHIVRAGLALLGAPLAGDQLYGGLPEAPFHQLHASALRLLEPSAYAGFPAPLEVAAPETFLDSLRHFGLN